MYVVTDMYVCTTNELVCTTKRLSFVLQGIYVVTFVLQVIIPLRLYYKLMSLYYKTIIFVLPNIYVVTFVFPFLVPLRFYY